MTDNESVNAATSITSADDAVAEQIRLFKNAINSTGDPADADMKGRKIRGRLHVHVRPRRFTDTPTPSRYPRVSAVKCHPMVTLW